MVLLHILDGFPRVRPELYPWRVLRLAWVVQSTYLNEQAVTEPSSSANSNPVVLLVLPSLIDIADVVAVESGVLV